MGGQAGGSAHGPGVTGRQIELVSRGNEATVLRMIKETGYGEAESRKILALVVKVEDFGKPGLLSGGTVGVIHPSN